MKQYVLLIACFLCHMGIQAQINHTVAFDPDKLIIDNQLQEDGNTYANLSYEDCSANDSVGTPSLPYRILRFIVPNEPVSFSIDINASGSIPIDLSAPLLPIQAPIPTSLNSARSEFIPSSFVTSGAYPEKMVQIIDEGYLDGDKRILTVKVTPVQYMASSNQLLFHSSVGFTINYNYNNLSSRNVARRISPIASPPRETAGLTKMLDFVENKSDINRILNSRPQVRATASTMNLPAYEYVVITSRSLAPYFRRLVDWKRQKGLNAGIVTMQDILSDASITKDEVSNLSDDAGKLRQYLKLAYDKGTRYVLLGGRREFVPIRYGTDNYGGNVQIPSDLYFSDLNGNWNRDGDSDLGEESDRLDYNPELYVGRLLCRDGEEINNYIDKLLLYEQNPGKGDYAYLKKALYMESDQMQKKHEGEAIANEFFTIFPDTTILRELPRPDSIPTYPTGKDVIDLMNNRFHGFVSWFAHGSPSGVKAKSNGVNDSIHYLVNAREGVYPAPWNEVETGNGLDNLINFNYPSVLYSTACTVVPYDIYVDGKVTYDMKYNVGESFTTGGKYGGVAFLGNTREGWSPFSTDLEKIFVNRMKSLSGKIGQAEAFSKADYKRSRSHWLALTHNLIGCPEFEMWTNIPSLFTNVAVTRSLNRLTVNTGVDSTNISLRGLFSDQRIYSQVGRAATFYPLPKNFVLTLHKHDYIPYVAPIYLQNESVTGTHYIKGSQITTGNSVDPTKATGDFVVKSGSDIVLEVSEGITLDAGTEIELGTNFEIKINN